MEKSIMLVEGAVLPSETPVPTEAPFTPEGFQIGELGLLRNPATGKNVLAMNPEADWQKLREEIIGGLWEANVDWARYTGQGSDASNYTKEAFIDAAMQGKIFHIGVPVRVNWNISSETPALQFKAKAVVLMMVDVSLNNIQIQLLDPYVFEKYTGMEGQENGQEAFFCTSGDATEPSRVALFTTDGNNLIISVGNFSLKDEITDGGRLGTIGHFDPALHEKRPTYFRPDRIGVEADSAVSITFLEAITTLDNYSKAHDKLPGTNGEVIKIIHHGIAVSYNPFPDFSITPKPFIFSP